MREVVGNEEISLTDVLRGLWRYRVILIVSLVVSCFIALAAVVFVYVATPDRQSASLPFRMLFAEAGQNQYPNGLKFDPSDVVASPVLEQVYQRNDLQQYLTFSQFKAALFVAETNSALSLLDKEYEQKLSNSKLSTVERQSLEIEFNEKRLSLRNGSYELNLHHTSGLFELPTVLIDKVLKDVLFTWAKMADEQKGAFKYRIPVYSRNILPPNLLDGEDYIVSIDIFADKIDKIFENIDQIALLPGAQLVRVGDGGIGLAEVSSNLNDTLRFKLQPLVGLVRSTGLSKNAQLASLYLQNQLFQLQLDQQEAQNKINVLERSLNFYLEKSQKFTSPQANNLSTQVAPNSALATTYIPQFGDSFLDRVVEMSTQSNDVQFRQEIATRIVDEGLKVAEVDKKVQYYTSLIEAMKKASKGISGYEEVIQLIKTRFSEIESDIFTALDQINAIYLAISKHNLRPQTELYAITDPLTVESYKTFLNTKVVMAGFLFVITSMLLTLFGCFIHFSIYCKKKIINVD